VATFVREGTCAYLDRFEGMNMWDDLLGAMAKPAHTAAVDRMTRTFVREMVSSYLSPPRPSPARRARRRRSCAAAGSPACSRVRGAARGGCARRVAGLRKAAYCEHAGVAPGDGRRGARMPL
jgi:anti-sigma factor RsiW